MRQWVDLEAAVVAEDERRSQHQELLNWVKPLKMVTTIDRYHNLPHIRNTSFHGRKVELESLATQLQSHTSPTTLLGCGIHGLGGSGKTQLALEFAYRHLSSYNAVFWISAETELKLAESFAAPAFELGITGESMQQLSQVRDIFKRWLYNNSRESKFHCFAALWIAPN